MTIGHDLLSYEVIDRFDKQAFLKNIDYIRGLKPEDHEQLSKEALEENRRHSFQLLGATNIVMLIVTTITIFGDLRTTIKALNSFTSDSVLLWGRLSNSISTIPRYRPIWTSLCRSQQSRALP